MPDGTNANLIKVTYENVENGGRDAQHSANGQILDFDGAAFEIATNGRATPQVALQDAFKNMQK